MTTIGLRTGLLALVASLAASLWQAAPALARDPATFHYLGETAGDPADPQGGPDTPFLVPQRHWPHWMAALTAALQKSQPAGATLVQQLLLRAGADHPARLALVWDLRDTADPARGGAMVFEIHDVAIAADGTVAPAKRLSAEDWLVRIVEPSGGDPFGTGRPLLFVEFGSGGSGYAGYELSVLALGAEIDEITPRDSGRPILAADLQRDGRFALVSSNDRWGNYFRGCGQCGPLVPVVSVWREGGLAEACRDFQAYYEARMDFSYRAMRSGRERGSIEDFLWNRAELVLNLLQAGRLEEAAYEYGLMIDEADGVRRQLGEARADQPQYRQGIDSAAAEWLQRVQADFEPLFRAVGAAADRACPLQAGEGPARAYGFVARVNRAR
ncbi:hypothetical protein [Ferrovibrio sp.]|uniref:hypothetical protein n=1 Tax=Ferrovibrio sp. TaxID=1917215 RepID=UPI003512562E